MYVYKRTRSKDNKLFAKIWRGNDPLDSYEKVNSSTFEIIKRVRLTHIRNPFSRNYDERWTIEILSISQRILRGGLPVYSVEDFDGDEISEAFYQSELQKVDVKKDDLLKVENMFTTRKKKKRKYKQCFVK